jgi:hypothetical protein
MFSKGFQSDAAILSWRLTEPLAEVAVEKG